MQTRQKAKRMRQQAAYLTKGGEDYSPIKMLDDDCLINIFKYLPFKNRIVIERVCKRWNHTSKESWSDFQVFKAETFIEHFGRDIIFPEPRLRSYSPTTLLNNTDFGKVFKRAVKFIKTFETWSICDLIDVHTALTLALKCVNLQHLEVFSNCVKESSKYSECMEAILRIVRQATVVRFTKVWHKPNDFEDILTKVFSNTNQIKTLNVPTSTNTILNLIAENCPKLECLKTIIHKDQKVIKEGVDSLAKLANLKRVVVHFEFRHDIKILKDTMRSLSACKGVESIKFMWDFASNRLDEFLKDFEVICNMLKMHFKTCVLDLTYMSTCRKLDGTAVLNIKISLSSSKLLIECKNSTYDEISIKQVIREYFNTRPYYPTAIGKHNEQ